MIGTARLSDPPRENPPITVATSARRIARKALVALGVGCDTAAFDSCSMLPWGGKNRRAMSLIPFSALFL